MPRGFVARLRVRQHDVPHLAVALEHAKRALEKRVVECGVDNIWRIVAEHLGHILGDALHSPDDYLQHLSGINSNKVHDLLAAYASLPSVGRRAAS